MGECFESCIIPCIKKDLDLYAWLLFVLDLIHKKIEGHAFILFVFYHNSNNLDAEAVFTLEE